MDCEDIGKIVSNYKDYKHVKIMVTDGTVYLTRIDEIKFDKELEDIIMISRAESDHVLFIDATEINKISLSKENDLEHLYDKRY